VIHVGDDRYIANRLIRGAHGVRNVIKGNLGTPAGAAATCYLKVRLVTPNFR
jgi:hypothetical protein